MSFPPSVLGWCFLIGGIAVLWLLIVFVRLWTRAAVSPREAKSAGYAHGVRCRRAAEAKGGATTEAADNGPGGRPAAPSGTTKCSCGSYSWHDPMCGIDPTDIDLDGLGTGDLAQLDQLEAWRRAGCPAVWPIPVVKGEQS